MSQKEIGERNFHFSHLISAVERAVAVLLELRTIDVLRHSFVPDAVQIGIGHKSAKIGVADFVGRSPTRNPRREHRKAVTLDSVEIRSIDNIVSIVGKLAEAVFEKCNRVARHFGVVPCARGVNRA